MSTTPSAPRSWTVEDSLALKVLTDARIAPDGGAIAFTVRAGYKDNAQSPQSNIWLARTSAEEVQQFTAGPRADLAPRWSPDGQSLAFLSDRDEDGRFGIYLLASMGGEARRLADLRGSVSELQWSPDGRSIAFLMTDPETEADQRLQQEKDDAIEFERDPKGQRAWIIDADGANPRPVTTGPVQVWELAWFPNGQDLALICSDFPYEWSWYQAYVARVPAAGGDVREIHRGRKQVALPSPAPDGQSVAFISGVWSDRGVVNGDLFVAPASGGEVECLTTDYPASFCSIHWRDERTLASVGYQDGAAALFRVNRDGGARALWSGKAMFADRHWAHASFSADHRTMALIREDPSAPPEVWTVSLGDDDQTQWIQRTAMHARLADIAVGETETVHWTSADGTPIQGILVRPVGYQPDRRYPLVTIIHGGPTAMYQHGYPSGYWTPLLTAGGCAVLLPNPRGSTGWGTAFAEANLGDMGGRDLEDILAGIDMLVEQGLADPERLGLGGWSYGGFMTAWAVTQTDRFKAALMGAGIANWRSFHGVSNLPTWDRRFYDADPYEVGGLFDRFSAVLQAHKVRTPTLILHGEKDEYVPVGQGYEFFRALKEHGVATEMVVYPREGHGVQEKAHVRHMLNRVVGWFGAHLGFEV